VTERKAACGHSSLNLNRFYLILPSTEDRILRVANQTGLVKPTPNPMSTQPRFGRYNAFPATNLLAVRVLRLQVFQIFLTAAQNASVAILDPLKRARGSLQVPPNELLEAHGERLDPRLK
jgi:hypothetical protein